MNIKEFIGKYRIIIVLVVMIVVLAFIKSYFGNKENENNTIISPTPTKTTVNTNSNSSLNNKTNESNDLNNQNNLTNESVLINQNNQENFQTNELVISNSETDKKREELTEKGRTFQTEEEYEVWFETLSFEDQELLLGYGRVNMSQLNNSLPYEGGTFIVKSLISNNIIQAKTKIDDLAKAEADLKNWLSDQGMKLVEPVISWE
ncbi:hypothetical protein SDC9_64074 [bioreactor metagenome]|uniref:Uncharacterized protein n=1 Tax=bioreactor metagenome TaxID=1076179 RepID=A0A644XNX1_9ZZZZ